MDKAKEALWTKSFVLDTLIINRYYCGCSKR